MHARRTTTVARQTPRGGWRRRLRALSAAGAMIGALAIAAATDASAQGAPPAPNVSGIGDLAPPTLTRSLLPARADGDGKYKKLIGTLECPKDAPAQGPFTDYGWWNGGDWCGKRGPAGFWVFVGETWYVWAERAEDPNWLPPAERQARAAVGGKYANLITTFDCAKDEKTYGDFHDYGRWSGGDWCGEKNTPAGYWVYVAPTWHIWRSLATERAPSMAAAREADAQVGGKYSELQATIHCPADVSTYGDFSDYGYWGGGAWCGATGPAGYWVYAAPTWYVWKRKR